MSRYSLPWDRTGAAAADSISKRSLASTRKSTAAFFYPPITPPPTSSNQVEAMSEPLVPPSPRTPPPLPPHPYQTYAAGSYATTPHSQTQLTPGRYPNTISTGSSTDGDADKVSHNTVQPTYVIHHHHHHHHSPAHADSRRLPPQPQHQPAVPPSRNLPPTPHLRKSRPLFLLILFLPLPPLLSVLYLLVGHKILVHASPSPTPSLLSSASAAATGGSILSLPLYLLLYLLLLSSPPNSSTGPTRTAHEDFFDDSDSHTTRTRTRFTTLATYAACGVLVLGVGGAAGALGVTCLAREGVGMLGPGKAAEAGVVGGLVLWAGVLVVCAVGAGVWWVLSLSLGRGRRVREDGLGKG
ncbi:hypothetical protein FPV67DRAFT_254792 [Lyophyllum atratum]|nr:hypothetical protein FPV67DRAFT_254792 [Lyophyllum atratum]